MRSGKEIPHVWQKGAGTTGMTLSGQIRKLLRCKILGFFLYGLTAETLLN